MIEIIIKTPFITLNQFLKIANFISNGGQAKRWLLENKVYVNDVLENRRGKKLYKDDVIIIDGKKYLIKETNQGE